MMCVIYGGSDSTCKFDLVFDAGDLIVPVKGKAEVNLRANCLKTLGEKFSPKVSVRTSMSDYKKKNGL